GEFAMLWRRWWWVLVPIVVFAVLASVAGRPAAAFPAVILLAAVVVVRRARHGRDLEAVLRRRWQRSMSVWMLSVWPGLASALRLEVRQVSGAPLRAGVGRPEWRGWTCLIPVALPPGLTR